MYETPQNWWNFARTKVEVRVDEGWKHSNNLDFAETRYITFAIDRCNGSLARSSGAAYV